MVGYLAYDRADIRFIYLHIIRLKQSKKKNHETEQLTRRKSIECHINFSLCKRIDNELTILCARHEDKE